MTGEYSTRFLPTTPFNFITPAGRFTKPGEPNNQAAVDSIELDSLVSTLGNTQNREGGRIQPESLDSGGASPPIEGSFIDWLSQQNRFTIEQHAFLPSPTLTIPESLETQADMSTLKESLLSLPGAQEPNNSTGRPNIDHMLDYVEKIFDGINTSSLTPEQKELAKVVATQAAFNSGQAFLNDPPHGLFGPDYGFDSGAAIQAFISDLSQHTTLGDMLAATGQRNNRTVLQGNKGLLEGVTGTDLSTIATDPSLHDGNVLSVGDGFSIDLDNPAMNK